MNIMIPYFQLSTKYIAKTDFIKSYKRIKNCPQFWKVGDISIFHQLNVKTS